MVGHDLRLEMVRGQGADEAADVLGDDLFDVGGGGFGDLLHDVGGLLFEVLHQNVDAIAIGLSTEEVRAIGVKNHGQGWG